MELKDEVDWLDMIYHHKVKQGTFHRNAMPDLPKNYAAAISSGRLEKLKQGTVYVGFRKRRNIKERLVTPFKVSCGKAICQITIVNDYLRTFSLGARKEDYASDNPKIDELLNMSFFRHYTGLWKYEGIATRRLLKKLMNM